MQKQKEFVIEQSYYFEAPPQRVFQTLTDPKELVKWFLVKAEVDIEDLRDYTFDWLEGYHQSGRVKQFEKNRAVSYSWGANTTASFELTKFGTGTLLRLHHTGFVDPEPLAMASSRWGYYLTNMKSVLDHGIDLRSKYDWQEER